MTKKQVLYRISTYTRETINKLVFKGNAHIITTSNNTRYVNSIIRNQLTANLQERPIIAVVCSVEEDKEKQAYDNYKRTLLIL